MGVWIGDESLRGMRSVNYTLLLQISDQQQELELHIHSPADTLSPCSRAYRTHRACDITPRQP